ncbi:MAG: DUF4190 domain-containing protein [Myxococcaceae bacterium]
MAVAATARCAVHPDAPAVELCQRCGNFVCGDCLELVEGVPYCTSCFKRSVSGSASKQAVAALVFSIIGLNCGFLPGIAGLVLGMRELRAIELNQSPAAGKSVAKAARTIGVINIVLLGLAVVGFLIWRVGRSGR